MTVEHGEPGIELILVLIRLGLESDEGAALTGRVVENAAKKPVGIEPGHGDHFLELVDPVDGPLGQTVEYLLPRGLEIDEIFLQIPLAPFQPISFRHQLATVEGRVLQPGFERFYGVAQANVALDRAIERHPEPAKFPIDRFTRRPRVVAVLLRFSELDLDRTEPLPEIDPLRKKAANFGVFRLEVSVEVLDPRHRPGDLVAQGGEGPFTGVDLAVLGGDHAPLIDGRDIGEYEPPADEQ